jgi:hypothetical protein
MACTKTSLAHAHAKAPHQTNLPRRVRALQGIQIGAPKPLAAANDGLGGGGLNWRFAQRRHGVLSSSCSGKHPRQPPVSNDPAQLAGNTVRHTLSVAQGTIAPQHFAKVACANHRHAHHLLRWQTIGLWHQAIMQGKMAHTMLLCGAVGVLAHHQQTVRRRLDGHGRVAGSRQLGG